MTVRHLLILLISLFLFAGCTSAESNSYSDLIAESDAVFLAQIAYISDTKADDSTAKPYYQIAFTVEQTVIDTLGLGSGFVMTLDGEMASTSSGEQVIQQLLVGDSIVVFAKEGVNGTQTVILPAANLNESLLTAEVWEQVQKVVSEQESVASSE